MTTIIDLAAGAGTRAPGRRLQLVPMVAIFGALTPVLSNMPVFDDNPLGNVLRLGLALGGIAFILANLARVMRNITGVEWLALTYFIFAIAIATVNAFIEGYGADPYYVAKMLVISLDVYLASKLLDSVKAIELYYRLFFCVAVFAGIQATIGVVATFFGVRNLYLVEVSTDPINSVELAWGGLLGSAGGDFRQAFYFSEPGYFAQLLLPAFAYALARRRVVGSVLIGFGSLGAFATGTAAAAVLALLLPLRFGRWRSALGLLIVCGVAAYVVSSAVGHSELLHFTTVNRTRSAYIKLQSLDVGLRVLAEHPFGLGLIDTTVFRGQFDPGPGITMMILQFGVLQLPLLVLIGGYLAYKSLISPPSAVAGAIALGMLGTMAAALVLGPIMKYWLIFLLGAVVTHMRILANEQRRPSANRENAFFPRRPRSFYRSP
jgi:MFS family permease